MTDQTNPQMDHLTPAMRRIAPELPRLRDEGISQTAAARRLGCSKSLVSRCAQLMGLEWTCGRKWGAKRRWDRDATRWVKTGRGDWMTIAEAARERGLPVGTVHERWQQGDRTAKRLLRPLNVYHEYSLGLSMAEWRHVLDYAEERGRQAAAQKFSVPSGAIRLIQEGHWECVE